MHPHDNRTDGGAPRLVAFEHTPKPPKLRIRELIVARVIESDEVNSVARPVIPGPQRCSIRPVSFSLSLNLRPIEQARELLYVAFARHRLHRFMIAAGQK